MMEEAVGDVAARGSVQSHDASVVVANKGEVVGGN